MSLPTSSLLSSSSSSSLIGEGNYLDELGMRSAAIIVAASNSPMKSTSSRGRRPSLSSSSTSIAVISRNSSFANSSSSSLNSSSHYPTLSEQNLQQYQENIINYHHPSSNPIRSNAPRKFSYSRELPYHQQDNTSNPSHLDRIIIIIIF
ncbi:predicted protein [Naegleria gruberi]|uniref:Predicted protein n=1 Tax=Naegleria gruberi TaxID=5762 RepID=D2V2J6_NAEGR|nr:uncharacterized protein NAEGRDRAFT_63022 [Naegleria gruberi]EFC49071.1 predicted protein [Naegleria gruberi]|eukprot:XP_002681815.1 predicted protein [Naegleria gruberi strain NEG-M]